MVKTEKTRLEELTRELAHAYFVQRDYAKLLQYLSPQISWFGTGANEVCRNQEEALRYLGQEQELYGGTFQVTDEWYHATLLTDSLACVMAEMGVETDASDQYYVSMEKVRFSVVYTRKDGWKICHIHNSIPYHDQGDAPFFDRVRAEQDQDRIQKLALAIVQEFDETHAGPEGEALETTARSRFLEILDDDAATAGQVVEVFDGYVEDVKALRRAQKMEGLRRAKERNIRLGRRPVMPPDGFHEIYEAIKAHKLTKAAAAKQLGVSANTVARLCERYEATLPLASEL